MSCRFQPSIYSRHLFRVCMVDLPWKHSNRREFRKDNPSQKTRFGIGAASRYRHGGMTVSEMCAMGPLVNQVLTPDAYVLFWVVENMEKEAWDVVNAWGFDWITTLYAWLKDNLKADTPFFGPGSYSGANLERCILLRRKKLKCWHSTEKGVYKPAQAITAPQARDANGSIIHSRKPVEAWERTERWLDPFLDGHPKLELFATLTRPGWTCLGGDVTGNDIRDDLRALARQMGVAA